MLKISILKRERTFNYKGVLFGFGVILFLFSALFKVWFDDLTTVYKFILLVVIFFYIPGKIIIRFLKLNLSGLDSFVLSLSTGLFFASEIYTLLGALTIDSLFPYLFLAVGLVFLIYRIKDLVHTPLFNNGAILNIKLDTVSLYLVIILAFFVGVAIFLFYPSTMIYPDGLHFYDNNAYDSIAQMSQIGELAHPFPHQFPFWANAPFKGYHSGSFLWLAILLRFGKFDLMTLFLKLRPLFIFPLLVLICYITMRRVLENRKIACMATFSVFFMGGLDWVIPLMRRIIPGFNLPTILLSGDIFGSTIFFNPPFISGLLAFFSGLYFWALAERTRKRSVILISAFFFALLFYYKAFMGVVVFSALILILLLKYFSSKDKIFLEILLINFILSTLLISKTLSKTASSIFKFSPAYLTSIKLNELGLIGSSEANTFWKSSPLLLLFAFIIFLIGNIGIRIVIIPRVYKYFRSWKNLSWVFLLFLACLFFSFLYTHTFTLNTVTAIGSGTGNFYFLFIIIINIFFAVEIYHRFRKSEKPIKQIAFLLVIFFIGCGAIPIHLLKYLPKNVKYKLVNNDELVAINYLREKTKFDSVILHKISARPWFSESSRKKIREGEGDRDAFFSGLAQRRFVLECSWHIAGGRYIPDFYNGLERRISDIETFFSTSDKDRASSILELYGVNYVWVSRGQVLKFDKYAILKPVFSNEDVTLYKVKH
ncbi:MAG: hypothetical protein V1674_07760 [Candidatus Omnitrophota bacterium]